MLQVTLAPEVRHSVSIEPPPEVQLDLTGTPALSLTTVPATEVALSLAAPGALDAELLAPETLSLELGRTVELIHGSGPPVSTLALTATAYAAAPLRLLSLPSRPQGQPTLLINGLKQRARDFRFVADASGYDLFFLDHDLYPGDEIEFAYTPGVL